MSWALTMASMYGPPPGWEGGKGTGWDSGTTGWEGGKGATSWDSGKGNGWDSKGKGPGKGKTGEEQPLSEPSCKAGSVSARPKLHVQVFVGGLPKVISEPQVRAAFEHFGNLLEAQDELERANNAR